jgi:hypothetical protein
VVPVILSTVQNFKDWIEFTRLILPLVLYGCENRFLTLREQHRVSVFENGAEKNIWTEEGTRHGLMVNIKMNFGEIEGIDSTRIYLLTTST